METDCCFAVGVPVVEESRWVCRVQIWCLLTFNFLSSVRDDHAAGPEGGGLLAATSRWMQVADRLLPPGTRRRGLISGAMVIVREARSAAVRTRAEWQRRRSGFNRKLEGGSGQEPSKEAAGISYQDWFCRLPADPSILAVQRQWFEEWPRPPRVWGVVVDDGGDVAVTEASLRSQSWGLVEVVKVESSGLAEEFHRLSQDCPKDLVVLLRAGDRLRPDAIFQIAQAVWRDPWLELVYWDDDLDTLARVWEWHEEGMPGGVYFEGDLDDLSQPRLKPGWSPDLLVGVNYIGRAFAVRARSLQPDVARRYQLAGVGDDSLWWDLLLGLELSDQQVTRLPAVLQTLTSRDDRIESHHVELVNRNLASRGWPARAEAGERGVNLAWTPDREARVSVIIATRHNRELLEGAFDLIRSAGYSALEIIIVDNGGQSPDNEAWYQGQSGDLDPHVIWWDEPFNYSAVNNRAVEQSTGEVLVFLNDDTSSGHPQWLHNLIGWAQRQEIGVAGLQLIDDRGLIQFGGVVIGMTGLAGHLFQGMAPHSDTLLGPTDWTRNTMSVTGACLAIRRSVFEEVGGFDERLELVRQRRGARAAGPAGRIPQCGVCGHPDHPQRVGHPRSACARQRRVRQLLGLPAVVDGRRPIFLPEPQHGPSRAGAALRGEDWGSQAAHRDAGAANGGLLPAQ